MTDPINPQQLQDFLGFKLPNQPEEEEQQQPLNQLEAVEGATPSLPQPAEKAPITEASMLDFINVQPQAQPPTPTETPSAGAPVTEKALLDFITPPKAEPEKEGFKLIPDEFVLPFGLRTRAEDIKKATEDIKKATKASGAFLLQVGPAFNLMRIERTRQLKEGVVLQPLVESIADTGTLLMGREGGLLDKLQKLEPGSVEDKDKLSKVIQDYSDIKGQHRMAKLAKDPETKEAFDRLKVLEEMIQENAPQTIAGQVVQVAISNLLPLIGTSIVAGPAAGLSVFGTQAFAARFSDSTLNGRSLEESILDGMMQVLMEAVPESVPLAAALRGGSSYLRRLLETSGLEGFQEMLTSVLEWSYDVNTLGEDITLREGIQKVINDGLVGFFAGGVMSTITHPAVKSAEKKAKTGAYSHKRSASKSFQPDIVEPGGPFLTLAEQERMTLLEEQIPFLAAVNSEDLTPDQFAYVQTRLHHLQVELADLQDKALTEIDENGQLTIKGVSLVDIEQSTTPQHEAELAYEIEKPENEVSPHLEINHEVNQKQLFKDIMAVPNKGKQIAEGMVKDTYENQLEAEKQKQAHNDWVLNRKGGALPRMLEIFGRDEIYQEELREMLDKHWPDSETVLLFNGHSPKRPAFQPADKLVAATGAGNASANVGMAMLIAHQKAGAELENAVVTMIEVPKSAIKAVNTSFSSELEFFFETKDIKHRGFFKFNDYLLGLQFTNFKDIKQKYPSHGDMTIALKGEKLPLIHVDKAGQQSLPGFGVKRSALQTIGPEQLSFVGELEASFAPEQLDLGLPEDATIWLREGVWKVSSAMMGTQGGRVFENLRSGFEYFMKFPENRAHARSEVLAAKLYELAGVNVAKYQFVADEAGQLGVASRWIPELTHTKAVDVLKTIPGVKEGFVVDAWLGNRDAIGTEFDNIAIEETPLGTQALRLDFGGALDFRAQGGKKPFGNRVTEIASMRDKGAPNRPSVQVFGDMTDEEISRHTGALQNISRSQIENVVDRFGPDSLKEREQLVDTLVARKEDILERFPPTQPPKLKIISQDSQAGVEKMGKTTKVILAKIFPKQQGALFPYMKNKRGEEGDTPVITKKRALLDLDKYNWWIKTTWTILQLGAENRHIPWLTRYIERQNFMANTKMNWMSRADQRVKEWQRLYKEQADALANLLFDVTEGNFMEVEIEKDGVKVITSLKPEPLRNPTPEELARLVKKHNVGEQALGLYFRIKQDFQDFLKAIEQAQITKAERTFTDQDQLNDKLKKIHTTMKALRDKPYFPLSRFGKYTVVVRSRKTGDVIYMEAHETRGQRNRAFERVRKMPEYKKELIRKSQFTEDTVPYRSLPPTVKEDIVRLLELDIPKDDAALEGKRVRKLAELEEILFEQSDASRFIKHFEQRKSTPGYSKDAMRNYADYFFRGSNHIARIQHMDELDDAIRGLEKELGDMTKLNAPDLDRRIGIVQMVKDHRNYLMNPGNDWSNLRALGFVWFIGFVPASAAINLTQVPLVGYPYLAARFGDVRAIRALTRAGNDVRKLYLNKLGGITDEKLRAINLGIRQNFLEESQAMELAAMATHNVLQRALPGDKVQRMFREIQYTSAWMFQTAEKFNRRIMFSAAFDMALQAEPDSKAAKYLDELAADNPMQINELKNQGWSDKHIKAFLAGKDAVNRTQYEYATWNRPLFMRGKKSVVFLFYNFIQNNLWFLNMFQNRPGSKRALLLLLFTAGLSGLPWAEDLQTFAKWLARQFGMDFDPERELREMLVELTDISPDVFLHGASRYNFGLGHVGELTGWPLPSFDLSGRLSMGQVLPGMDFLNQGDFDYRFLRGATDASGAVGSGLINIMQAIADSKNPDQWKRWERAFPSSMKNMSKGFRRYVREGEQSRNFANIVDYDPNDPEHLLENIGQAAGFAPTRVNQEWDRIRMQQESAMFWDSIKSVLMSQFDAAIEMNDREGKADVRKAIKQYNNTVPFRNLRISGDKLEASRKNRARARALQERGLLPQKSNIPLSREINRLFPESETVQEETLR